jgi:DNA-binding winged helix-turn-helix (wHTH) protein/tetratricopeptide (TPR) repeat protein
MRGGIRLSEISPFQLGEIRVEPGTRQIFRSGHAVTLEPRVMKVLVALAQRKDQVVSRDELIARCWDFRAVGDNAIHRAVSRVREIGAAAGQDNFRIETISKVGYKLVAKPYCAASPGPARQKFGTRRRLALVAAIAAVLVPTGLFFYHERAVRGSDRRFTVSSQRNDPLTLSVAAMLSVKATAQDPQLRFQSGSSDRADFKFAIDPVPEARTVRLRLTTGDNQPLWETAVQEAPPEVLNERIAASLGGILICGRRLLDTERDPEVATWRLAFAACAQRDGYPDERGLLYLRALARAAPKSPSIWALLAHHEASMAETWNSQAASRSLKISAKRHAEQAIALQSANALAYAVMAQLTDPPDWSSKIRLGERANSIEPGSSTASLLHAQSLQSVGRLSEAEQSAYRAVNLDPFSAPARAALVQTLGDSGRTNAARTELGNALRIWPDSPAIKYAKSRFEFRYGEEKTLTAAQIEQLGAYSEAAETQLKIYLLSKQTTSARNLESAVTSSSRILSRNPDIPFFHLQLLARLGRVNEAYRVLDDDITIQALRTAPYILFRPHMRSLWQDPRFMTLAARVGLVDYWISTQTWPDFCREPSVPYECREEAEKAARSPAKSRLAS